VSDDPCAPIHEILARLRRDYEKACEPWLKMLADYAAARPPAPFIVPADQPSACLHGVRSPHECKECADAVSSADASAWLERERAANQPPAAAETPEAMYNPVARESHAGASARQIDVAAGFELSDGDVCYCGGIAHKRTARCPPRATDQQSECQHDYGYGGKCVVCGDVRYAFKADEAADKT
jgi:hypothetical protein